MRLSFTSAVGKKRRLQFVECPNDINGMIDAAKIADLALLLIDGSYGFEMVSNFCSFTRNFYPRETSKKVMHIFVTFDIGIFALVFMKKFGKML